MTELEPVAWQRKSRKNDTVKLSDFPMYDSPFNRANWEEQPLVTLSSAQSAIAEAREKALEEAMLTALKFAQEKQKHWDDDLGEYVMRKSSDAHAIVAAICALKETP